MGDDAKKVGQIVWVDLTVGNAKDVREFYQSVTGWDSDEFNMGDYSDYVVSTPQDKDTVAGICHARGSNSELPPYWLVYIKVANLEESLAEARKRGGELVSGPKEFGAAQFCILRDPAGAYFGIIEGDAEG
ncbi:MULTISPECIES: VOC family protein [unclassified Novosphingobium]|jgi:predicted enzyme related to lactoylglutathione lyase|uniref:VOC family protein n=1 Tax=unclassified Novosphingobium TaxID=2644732 RepID=UPI0025F923C1|nr:MULTISPECIES: VOC family protein [unclassified Novosphingobium]HQV04680.1 VOC family protein [Novosphingobium sp.]